MRCPPSTEDVFGFFESANSLRSQFHLSLPLKTARLKNDPVLVSVSKPYTLVGLSCQSPVSPRSPQVRMLRAPRRCSLPKIASSWVNVNVETGFSLLTKIPIANVLPGTSRLPVATSTPSGLYLNTHSQAITSDAVASRP